MESLNWQKVCVLCVALACATLVECLALLLGINGYILGAYMAIVGSVAGVPVGTFLERKRKGAPD